MRDPGNEVATHSVFEKIRVRRSRCQRSVTSTLRFWEHLSTILVKIQIKVPHKIDCKANLKMRSTMQVQSLSSLCFQRKTVCT